LYHANEIQKRTQHDEQSKREEMLRNQQSEFRKILEKQKNEWQSNLEKKNDELFQVHTQEKISLQHKITEYNDKHNREISKISNLHRTELESLQELNTKDHKKKIRDMEMQHSTEITKLSSQHNDELVRVHDSFKEKANTSPKLYNVGVQVVLQEEHLRLAKKNETMEHDIMCLEKKLLSSAKELSLEADKKGTLESERDMLKTELDKLRMQHEEMTASMSSLRKKCSDQLRYQAKKNESITLDRELKQINILTKRLMEAAEEKSKLKAEIDSQNKKHEIKEKKTIMEASERILGLEGQLNEKDCSIEKIRAETVYYRQELINREENYNRRFANRGVADTDAKVLVVAKSPRISLGNGITGTIGGAGRSRFGASTSLGGHLRRASAIGLSARTPRD